MRNPLILLSLAILLGACSSGKSRFPTYNETVQQHKTVGLVVDLFTYRDILGTSRGINLADNEKQLNAAIAQLTETLNERGFQPVLIESFIGLTHELDEKENYVISEEWRSTTEPYSSTHNTDSADAKRNFLRNLVSTAKLMNAKKSVDQKAAETELCNETELSECIKISERENNPFDKVSRDVDVIVFAVIDGRFQKLSKYLARGLFTGVATSALTGIAIVPPGSYAITDLVAFNPKTNQILWHHRRGAEGQNGVSNSVKGTLNQYPYANGTWSTERLRQEQIKNKRKKRT